MFDTEVFDQKNLNSATQDVIHHHEALKDFIQWPRGWKSGAELCTMLEKHCAIG